MNHISTEILFEKFELIECLKKDGQAAVYLANHIFLSKKIILKTLNTDGLADKTILERFKREAKILAQLDHPNIIKVLDFGMFNNFFYISFEYFPGRNLREVINNNHLTNDDKMLMTVQLLKALNAAHKNGIVHRDIKPENILINSSHELKIADFGLALVMNDNNLTQSSTVVGTPSYMSPEQIRGEKSYQTDLFSAGLVCFELLTGRNPVLGKDVGATINNILNFNYDQVSKEIGNLSPSLHQVLESMLHTSLTKRAKSAGELLKCLGLEEEQSEAVINITKPANKIYFYAAAVIIGLVLFVVLYMKFFTADKSLNLNALQTKEQVNTEQLQVNMPANAKQKTVLIPDRKIDDEKPVRSIKVSTDSGFKKAALLPGKLSIDCYPWAEVYLDNKKIDITPLHNFSLAPGRHKVELQQPEYPAFRKFINITSGNTETINVNFDDIVGYLDCEIYPWGEVYVDDKFVGTTPFAKPIAVTPGNHKLTIKNANYAPVSKVITAKAKQRVSFSLNFQELTK